ncbi:hypothetical protein Tco_0098142 [Tanacetum coccineum]
MPYRAMWDTAYRRFLGVRTTFDIFQNILLLYIEYGVLSSSGYDILNFIPLLSFVKCRHGYAVYSLMDMAYRIVGIEFIVVSVVGAGVSVGVDCCGRGVIGGIVRGMVDPVAAKVSKITVTCMLRRGGV